jgi:putative FmdB family regulatory protein
VSDALGYNSERFYGLAVLHPNSMSLAEPKVNVVPIYEYQCESCGHALEILQKLSDAPAVDCPACAKPTLKKQISAAGFRLKGGGWYETDFKSGSKKNIAGDTGSSGSAAAPSATSDTKSAAVKPAAIKPTTTQ